MGLEEGLETLQNGITTVIGEVKSSLSNPIISGAVGAVVGSAATGIIASSLTSSKKKTTKRKKKVSKRKTRRSKRKSKARYTPHTAGKGKDRSHKRIRQTKNGQPYIIMANGRARFISKSSAKRSRKLKGGRY